MLCYSFPSSSVNLRPLPPLAFAFVGMASQTGKPIGLAVQFTDLSFPMLLLNRSVVSV